MNKPHFRRVPRVALLLVLLVGQPLLAQTNVPPTPVVFSALQRPGTTFMDIDFRVNDPDDATVEVHALGFVNGGTTFADIVKISTLVEGTEANLGTNVPANTNLRLTWNVAADWNTNFGNVQVEILAQDGRGLLPFHWITLPTNGPNPEITINRWPITDSHLLPLWYWLIAKNDPAIALVDGQIVGVGGDYDSEVLARRSAPTVRGLVFLWERLNIRSVSRSEVQRAQSGRYGFQEVNLMSVALGKTELDRVYGWPLGEGTNAAWLPPAACPSVSAVALGGGGTLILSAGRVFQFPDSADIPASATNVTAIAVGAAYVLALRADGTIVGWGDNEVGQTTIPAAATNVQAIAAGEWHSLALRYDGTIVVWGYTNSQVASIPVGVTNVLAIAAGRWGTLALQSNGTVDAWGMLVGPANATNVVAIATGFDHSLALRADGTVVAGGDNSWNQATVPASLTNAVAIAAGYTHSVALKADGTVVVWGDNSSGQLNIPAGVSGIDLLGVGGFAGHIVVVDKRTP